MADDQKLYPRGQLALGNGDLIDVTNVKHDITNNSKQIHTIRRQGSGITLGVQETTVSFDAVVSEDGAERDYLRDIKRGTIRKLRIKVPDETITINGVAQSRSLELPLDDAIKYSITFIGHTED
jgi:hypothetical protein